MEILIFIAIILSFITTLVLVPLWIKRAKEAGLVGRDLNKYDKRDVAESGGAIVIFGFVIGVLVYVAIKTFYFHTTENLVASFAILTVILLVSFIGMIDDLLGWKIGLDKRVRILLVFFAAIPLMVINAGDSTMSIPFLDKINFGILYPLVIIPIGVIGASFAFNSLAGYNGLETGQGILILGALALVSFFTGTSWLSIIALCMIASLIAFWMFNKYPAKVFPGDIMTYSIGALIAGMAILGNYEGFAVFIFIPYIIEVFLKCRGKLKMESFSKANKDGSLDEYYNKIYGLEHFSIRFLKKLKGRVYEGDIVYFIHIIQIIFIIIGLLVFSRHIF